MLGGDRSIQLSYGGLYRKYSILQGSRIRTIRFLGGGPSIPVRYGGILCYAILHARSSRGKKLCILFNILLHGRKNVNPGGKEKQTKIPEKTLLK